MPTTDVSDEIARLRREFCARTLEQMDTIESAQRRLTQEQDTDGTLNEIHMLVHGLSGTGTVFGFPKVSDTAAPLQVFVDGILRRDPTSLTDADAERLDELIKALRAACADVASALTDPA